MDSNTPVPKNIPNLISKFLLNKLKDDEKEELRKWANASEENRRLFIHTADVNRLMNIFKNRLMGRA